jgi:hypothetical protein
LAKAKKPAASRRAQKVARPRKPLPKSKARVAARPAKATAVRNLLAGSLADSARAVLARSGWQNAGPELAKDCRDLIARLAKTCPFLVVERPLAASEVAGEIGIKLGDFRDIMQTAAGATMRPRTVWSDGANELLVETAAIDLSAEEGLIHVLIPVYCEETAKQLITVSFATGNEDNPSGLIFAADTKPDGPSEIVEIWGEALLNLAWTSLLRSIATLAEVSGRDQDGAGLVPAAFSTHGETVKMLIMARHEFERVTK